ncbi:MAG: response regulator transcription factor [Anaerolineales bacterium]|jgi:DNA-binding NarL/FixJ family response regulator
MNPIRVIIADDHPIVRSGVRGELALSGEFKVVGEALDGDQALRLTLELRPDVLILDVNMPGMKAIQVLYALQEGSPETRVLVLTAYNDTGTVVGLLKAGADGYLLKDEDPRLIPEAVRVVSKGETWLSPALPDEVARMVWENQEAAIGETLTGRELEVLHFLEEGRTNKEIALEMQTSERTVEFHVSNIFDKLGVKSRLEAALWAKEHGFL